MAHSRKSSRKKGHKAGKHRSKLTKRQKAWRRGAIKRYGSVKAAKAALRAQLGHGGHRGKAGKKAKHHGKRGKHKRHHRSGSHGDYKLYLAQIQAANNTTGWPATAEEKSGARYLAEDYSGVARHGTTSMSEAEKLKRKYAAEKQALVKKIAGEKLRKARAEENARQSRLEHEAAEREAEAELRDL